MSPRAADYIVSAHRLMTGRRTRGEAAIAAERDRDVAPYLDLTRRLRILDVANGRLRPQYCLLRAAGQGVVGIDRANRPTSSWADHGYRVARWMYARQVRPRTNAALDGTLVCGDVALLPFASGVFDLATSVAAFEHFLDVPAVVAELSRVLRPGGVAWIRIHLFTCPSGGHNVSATEIPLKRMPRGMDAWDHLRRRRVPLTVPLNEWRSHQYVAALARHFEVLKHGCAMREGEELLTPALAAELAGYSRDELTCGAFVIVARKSAPPRP